VLDRRSGGVGPFEAIVSRWPKRLALRVRALEQDAPTASPTACQVDMKESVR
jgi:hypothetical protein